MLGVGLTSSHSQSQSQSPPASAAMVPTRSTDEWMEDESLAQRFDSALHLTCRDRPQSQRDSVSSADPSRCASSSNYSHCTSGAASLHAQHTQPHAPHIFPRRSSALILPPPPSPQLSLPHHRGSPEVSDCPSVHLISDDGHSQIPLRALSTGRSSSKPCLPRTSASDLPIAELLRLLFPLASSSASARTMRSTRTNTNRRRDRSITPPSRFARGSCAPPSSPILASSSCFPSSFTPPTHAPPNSPLSLTPAFALSAADMDDDIHMTGSSSPTRGFADEMMAVDLGSPSLPHSGATLSPTFPPHPPTPPTPTPTISDLHVAMSQYSPPVSTLTTLFGHALPMASTGFESPVMSNATGNAMMHLPASPPLSPKCASATPKTQHKSVTTSTCPSIASGPGPGPSSLHEMSHSHRKRKSSRAAALAVLSGVSTASTSSIAKRTFAARLSASSAAPSAAEKVRQQRRVKAMVKNLARQLDGLSMD